MRTLVIVFGGAIVGLAAITATQAHEDMDLPKGPIRDRHELMEAVGKNAKAIGDAMKAGKIDTIVTPATEIAAAAKKVPALFPAGSADPKSRAKAEIWKEPDVFAAAAKKLEDTATALAKAADANANVAQAAGDLFAACKSCHTKFRVPEE